VPPDQPSRAAQDRDSRGVGSFDKKFRTAQSHWQRKENPIGDEMKQTRNTTRSMDSGTTTGSRLDGAVFDVQEERL
jgi:hypothetical protein